MVITIQDSISVFEEVSRSFNISYQYMDRLALQLAQVTDELSELGKQHLHTMVELDESRNMQCEYQADAVQLVMGD